MPPAYSIDLRTRILEADRNEEGLQRQIAARFSVLIQVKAISRQRRRSFPQPLRYQLIYQLRLFVVGTVTGVG
jgi:hypothetical protein